MLLYLPTEGMITLYDDTQGLEASEERQDAVKTATYSSGKQFPLLQQYRS